MESKNNHSSCNVQSFIFDSQVTCELFELLNETRIGTNTWSFLQNVSVAGMEVSFVFVHHVCDEERSRTGNPGSTVDEHISFLPFLFDQSNCGVEDISDLLLLVITEVEFMVGNRGGEVKTEVCCGDDTGDTVLSQQRDIFGEVESTEPDLP